jgi:hypothetical protein
MDGGDNRPVWRIGRIDAGGPWCPHEMTADDFGALLKRLKDFETMTWPEIERGGSHFIGTESLIAEAQKRLADLHLDDFEQLFSLRLHGKPRLWGLRFGSIFSALWWDAEHAICPAPKKHT